MVPWQLTYSLKRLIAGSYEIGKSRPSESTRNYQISKLILVLFTDLVCAKPLLTANSFFFQGLVL